MLAGRAVERADPRMHALPGRTRSSPHFVWSPFPRKRRSPAHQGGPIKVPDLRGLEWVRVLPDPRQHQSGLWMLDAGERDTLELALERHAELVIIDERIGRNVAEYLGLRITGTLGVLVKARQQRLILSFRGEVAAMRREGIHYHPRLIDRLAPMVGE